MSGSVIDLSLRIQDGMPVYPGDTPVSVEPYHTIEQHGSNSTKLTLGTHAGTHMDAPRHMIADGATLDQIPLVKCVGPATVLDFSAKGPEDRIELDELTRYERFVEEGSRILLRTDWSKRFGDESYFADWPALTEDASRWLAGRGIWLLGMETPSVDRRKTHANHAALLGAEVVLIEGLANLDRLRVMRVFFVALPLSLPGRDGSPVRAVAMEEEADAPDIRKLALAETLKDATPYVPALSVSRQHIHGVPFVRHLMRS